MTNYLPEGFESLQTEKSYINLPKLPEGEYRYRIVLRPIAGWLDWKDKKPYRFRPDNKPDHSFDEERPMKAFWSFYVWDYAQEGLFIMEVTQMSILKALTHLGRDEDWGDFTQYDIKIKKSGSGKETEYSVSPVPHKPLAEKIALALAKKPVNLEALYEGGDPWKSKGEAVEKSEWVLEESPLEISLQSLKKALRDQGSNVDHLEEYIQDLSEKKNQSADKIISSALIKELLPRFKSAYSKWMHANSYASEAA